MATLLNGGYCTICKTNCGKSPKNMETHFKGKKHQRALPKTVTISGLSPDMNIDDVNNYFNKFGKISTFTHNKSNGSITYSFENKDTLTEVILRNHMLDGKIFQLTWQTPQPQPLIEIPAKSSVSQPPPTTTTPTPIPNSSTLSIPQLDQTDILDSIRTVKKFDDKIKLLRDKLRQNEKQIAETCKQITNDLQQAVRRHFPLCEIFIFGSTITQLDYLGCDLDIYIKNVKSTDSTEVTCLTRIKSDLYKSKKFNELILIRTAKGPIIKCKHTLTKTNCDINVKNMLPIYNSQLINYYLTIDDRLHQLMIFIKYLFHLHDFKKSGYFSSYSLTWLFIFYLQQSPYCLPSVKQLEIDIGDGNQLEDGWNCNFKQLKKFRNNPKLKEASLLEIFVGFLKFYINFDYTTKVICPYLGKSLNRTDFLTLPDSFILYKKNIINGKQPLHINSAIVIQDPFEHNRNITAVTVPHCLGRFVLTCEVFLKDYLKGQSDPLKTLLTRPLLKVQEYNTNFAFNYPQIDDFKQFKSDFTTKIRVILSDILKFEINESNVFPQYSEIVGEQYVNITAFKCRGSTNIWQNRMTTFKNLQQKSNDGSNNDTSIIDATPLKQDIDVTTQLIKNFAPSLNIGLTMRFIYDRKLSRMHCFLHSDSNCKLFSYTAVFFRNRIVPWLLNQESEEGLVDVREESQKENDNNVSETEKTNNTSKHDQRQSQSVTDNQVSSGEEQTTEIKEEISPEMPEKITSKLDENHASPSIKVENPTTELEDIGDSNKKGDLEVVDVVEEQDADEDDGNNEEEDVPDDFFDDFSNADFMEGLDIVDAWDEDAAIPSNNEETSDDKEDNNQRKEQKESNKHHSSHDRSTTRHSKDHQKRSRDDRLKGDESKRRSRTPKRRRLHSNSHEHRCRSKSRDRDRHRLNHDSLRRDPVKTRRDICKDKMKCARDKEMRIVSDKLKLVETGLVPPGTEMDVDLNEFDSFKRQDHHHHHHQQQQQQQSRLSVKEDTPEKHRSLSSKRYNTSRDRNRSNSRDYLRKRHSRSGEGSITRKRRGDSRHSDLSDREIWLRETRTSRKRSRSISPATRLARKQDIAKKRSFLEEIREKLNEVNCPLPTIPLYTQQQQQQQMYPPQPVPAPVPPPLQQHEQHQQHYYENQQYDQSYFIGSSGNFVDGGVSNMPLNIAPQTIFPIPITPANTLQYPTVSNTVARSNLMPVSTVTTNQTNIEKDDQQSEVETSDATKLFADKKISLSDFLTITAKSEVQSSTPEYLQKKIKVISRCQDALKALSDERKFTGRLRVKPSKEKKTTSEGKYQSPLRKIPIVRFRFTTRTASPPGQIDTFASALDKILQKTGLIRDTVDLEGATTTDLSTSSIEDTSILAVKASQLLLNKKDGVVLEKQPCEECKKRKDLVFSDVGIQCADNKEMVTRGIQVNEDELQPSKSYLKDSIAFLTPAQLLKKTKEKEEILAHDDLRRFLKPSSSSSSSSSLLQLSPNKTKPPMPPTEFLKNFRQNPDPYNNNSNNNWSRMDYRENYRYSGNPDLDRHPSSYNHQNFYDDEGIPPPPHHNNYDDHYRARYGPFRY